MSKNMAAAIDFIDSSYAKVGPALLRRPYQFPPCLRALIVQFPPQFAKITG